MRHNKKRDKLSRKGAHKKALLRNLATALFEYESIKTTITKAKVLRPFAEKIITKARTNTVQQKRLVGKNITKREVLIKLFDNIALRYKNRNGGYTRIYRLGYRLTDGAEMAIIELVPELLNKTENEG